MYFYNYKNLPYKKSIKRFIKDYRLKYFLYGRNSIWKTKNHEEIKVKDLNKRHLIRIVEKFGNTFIRTNYPFIWYRYLKIGDNL